MCDGIPFGNKGLQPLSQSFFIGKIGNANSLASSSMARARLANPAGVF
jgi:hypothetical protein